MNKAKKRIVLLGGLALLAAGALIGSTVDAADHNDPPGRAPDDHPADIGDVYAWHDQNGTADDPSDDTMTLAMTFGGPLAPAPDQKMECDNGALYGLHLDTNTVDPLTESGNLTPEHDIYVRFGLNDAGECGMLVQGLPGADSESFVGAAGAGTAVESGAAKAAAGFFDDPFFFDLDGFKAAVGADDGAPDGLCAGNTNDGSDCIVDVGGTPTPNLTMVHTRDFFEGKNISAIVVEFPVSALTLTEGAPIRIWGTTARKGA